MLATAFAPSWPVATLDPGARLLLRAVRTWVMLASRRGNPRPAMTALLGTSAGRFGVLMDRVTCAWPDVFTTYPPCASALSSDEATLVAMLNDAAEDASAAFDRRLVDLLPFAQRQRIWAAARAVAADWLSPR